MEAITTRTPITTTAGSPAAMLTISTTMPPPKTVAMMIPVKKDTPIRARIRPRTAFHVCPNPTLSPRAASLTTYKIKPLRIRVANDEVRVGRMRPIANATSSLPRTRFCSPREISSEGRRKAPRTITESPMVASGLRRMVLIAPPKMSPSFSGRRGMTPG